MRGLRRCHPSAVVQVEPGVAGARPCDRVARPVSRAGRARILSTSGGDGAGRAGIVVGAQALGLGTARPVAAAGCRGGAGRASTALGAQGRGAVRAREGRLAGALARVLAGARARPFSGALNIGVVLGAGGLGAVQPAVADLTGARFVGEAVAAVGALVGAQGEHVEAHGVGGGAGDGALEPVHHARLRGIGNVDRAARGGAVDLGARLGLADGNRVGLTVRRARHGQAPCVCRVGRLVLAQRRHEAATVRPELVAKEAGGRGGLRPRVAAVPVAVGADDGAVVGVHIGAAEVGVAREVLELAWERRRVLAETTVPLGGEVVGAAGRADGLAEVALATPLVAVVRGERLALLVPPPQMLGAVVVHGVEPRVLEQGEGDRADHRVVARRPGHDVIRHRALVPVRPRRAAPAPVFQLAPGLGPIVGVEVRLDFLDDLGGDDLGHLMPALEVRLLDDVGPQLLPVGVDELAEVRAGEAQRVHHLVDRNAELLRRVPLVQVQPRRREVGVPGDGPPLLVREARQRPRDGTSRGRPCGHVEDKIGSGHARPGVRLRDVRRGVVRILSAADVLLRCAAPEPRAELQVAHDGVHGERRLEPRLRVRHQLREGATKGRR